MSLLGIVRNQHILLLLLIQLTVSLCFIYHGKNKLSYLSELVVLAGFIFYHQPSLEMQTILVYLAEYLSLHILLVLIVYLARRFAFFILVVISHKEKYHILFKLLKRRKRFLILQKRIWNNINYGIRIKKGIPYMVNKRNIKENVLFDSDGFPKFKAIVEIQLPRRYWRKSRTVHFYQANKELYQRIQRSSRLAKKFTKKDLKEIKDGNTPSKYTWHHHQNSGLLQLVDYEIHSAVRHDGGYSIWGPRK